MATKRQNLFSKLTRLFRAGPVVKRKIKGVHTGNIKSSALDVFRKSTATVYGNSLNAYGQYDRLSRYADFCLSGDTKVPTNTPQGWMTIEEMAARHSRGEKIYVFSYDRNTDSTVCSPISNAWMTKVEEIIEVEFDKGLKLKCTKNHPIMLRDGSYCRADELSAGMAVMPFYRKKFNKTQKNPYRYIYSFSRGWKPEHILVAELKTGLTLNKSTGLHVHHENFIDEDNALDNLSVMTEKDHLSLHAKINNKRFDDPKAREYMSKVMLSRWSDGGDLRENLDESTKKRLSHPKWGDCVDRLIDYNKTVKPGKFNAGRTDQKGSDNANADKSLTAQSVYNAYECGMTLGSLSKKLNTSKFKVLNRVKWAGYESFDSFIENYENHKVVAIHELGIKVPVYDLTVPNYHNFAVCDENSSGICFVHNSEMEYCIHGDTNIDTVNDGYQTIKELADKGVDKEFLVWSWDPKLGLSTPVWAKQARKTRTDHSWKITFNNEKHIIASSNHRLMTQNGIYAKVEDLSVGDYVKDSTKVVRSEMEAVRYKNRCSHKIPDEDFIRLAMQESSNNLLGFKNFVDQLSDFGFRGGDSPASDLAMFRRHYDFESFKSDPYHGFTEIEWTDGLEIVSIEYYGEIDLYDLTVDGYKNFATDSAISHNTPEIASAVDIYADETVAKDDKGRSLHIHSENPKIKKILDELFYDTLNFEFVNRSWVRNLCKYGDHMLLLDVAPGYGIINAHPIPVNEIEREEGFDPNNPFAVRFRWVTEGNQVLENWQVAHFRLLGNDTFLPYGSSVLEPARRIWRQLVMAEDAMLVYRVIRSPERRVFYIDVANAPPNDVPQIIENAKTTLKSQEVVDSTTGRVDQRYNPWSVDIDYFIPVRGDQTTTRIETLPGGANTTAIDDVEYIQRKLFAALKVPKPYLGFDEGLGSKANLAQEDIRFARSIQQIQQVVIAELNKIAAIHLASSGFDGEDLIDFSLSLSNPSTMAQQQKLELIRTKLEIAGTRPEGLLSDRYFYKEVFDMTDDYIEKLEEDQVRELLRKAKLEDFGGDGDGDGGFGGGGGGGFGGGGGGFGGDLGGDDFGGDLGGGLEDGGDAFDLGDEGGDEDGGDDEGGDEEDLFADEGEKDGEVLSDGEFFILGEDEDDESFEFTSETEVGAYVPVVKQNQLARYKHNNRRPSRTKDRGPKGLKTPNPGDPLKHDDPHYKDVYGDRVFKGSPFKLTDSVERSMSKLEDVENKHTRLNMHIQDALKSLPKSINISKDSKKVLSNLIIESDEDEFKITGDDE